VVEKPSGEEVGSYMARNFLSVKPDTPLAEVIRKMIDVLSQHVVVLDEENKPLGILSAPDIVAALARERPGFSIGEGS
jgi:CBS domain-containing protein